MGIHEKGLARLADGPEGDGHDERTIDTAIGEYRRGASRPVPLLAAVLLDEYFNYCEDGDNRYDWKTFRQFADPFASHLIYDALGLAEYWADKDAEANGQPELTEWEDPTVGFPKQI